jgi:hypothetical protein
VLRPRLLPVVELLPGGSLYPFACLRLALLFIQRGIVGKRVLYIYIYIYIYIY